MAEHYNLEKHSSTSYTVKIVRQEKDKNRRLRLEEAWTHLLDTFQPKGLNLKLKFLYQNPARNNKNRC